MNHRISCGILRTLFVAHFLRRLVLHSLKKKTLILILMIMTTTKGTKYILAEDNSWNAVGENLQRYVFINLLIVIPRSCKLLHMVYNTKVSHVSPKSDDRVHDRWMTEHIKLCHFPVASVTKASEGVRVWRPDWRLRTTQTGYDVAENTFEGE